MYQPLDTAAKAIALRPGRAYSIFVEPVTLEPVAFEPKPFQLVPSAPVEAEPNRVAETAKILNTQPPNAQGSGGQDWDARDVDGQVLEATNITPTCGETGEESPEAAEEAASESASEATRESIFREPTLPAIDFSQPYWSRLAISGLLLALPLGVSAAAYHVIATPPQPNCNQPQQLRADLAELQCLRRAMQSDDNADIIRSLQALQNWSKESPVYALSQRLLEDWSVVALSLAHQEFEAGQWENAARLATAVPAQIELGSQAQERLTLWQRIQKQGEVAHKRALTALEQQDWKAARIHAQTLANIGNDYWRQQGIHKLPEQIKQAQQAQQPDSNNAELSASRPERSQPTPSSGAQQHQLLPAALPSPRRSRFSMPVLISLERLTVVDPKPATPDFSALA